MTSSTSAFSRSRSAPKSICSWGLALALPLITIAVPACAARSDHSDVQGAYQFENGDLVSIRRSVGKTFRARFFDTGKSRRLHPDGGLKFTTGSEFSATEPLEATVEFRHAGPEEVHQLIWAPVDSPPMAARRVNRSQQVRFASDGLLLAGRIDFPDPTVFGRPVAAVALVHGSGTDAATEFFYSGDFLAAHGIATLTYDKRGTGQSAGTYTFDFHQLARDAAAAVAYLSSHPALSGLPLGLTGYSQGGWTAPLAASLSTRVDFVVVSYGLVASPAEEARVETRNLLRSRGVEDEDLDDVSELTSAAVEVVASSFKAGWGEFGRLKKRHRHAPWARELRGTTVGRFLRLPRWLIRLVGPLLAPKDLPWHYDSMSVLEGLDVPMAWLLAEADTSAPIELALPMLERLQAKGHSVQVKVFPGADHAMIMLPDGYAPGYFRAEVEAVVDLSAAAMSRDDMCP